MDWAGEIILRGIRAVDPVKRRVTVLADRMGVSYQTIRHWRRNGVPEARIQRFSTVTGIPAHEVRPDLANLFSDRAAAGEAA